jgi:hypothetical protein
MAAGFPKFCACGENVGEVVVETAFGAMWGCQTSGLKIALDLDVQDIFKPMRKI